MACMQEKLCVAISERCRKRIWYLKALYKCLGLLSLLFVANPTAHRPIVTIKYIEYDL